METHSNIALKSKLQKDTLKISRFKEQIKRTKPHKHDNYYELIILLEGNGFHQIESKKYVIQAPVCYFLQPGQMHYWQFTSIPKGYVILFNAEEFDAITENPLCQLYKQLVAYQQIILTPNTVPSALLEILHEAYQTSGNFSRYITHGLLQSLFASLLHISQESTIQIANKNELFEQFSQLIHTHISHYHKVHQYANILHTTPQNLSTICVKFSGKSAATIIAHHLLLEAKRYILHTDKTVFEIADLLSFSDSSHFVKFFKKNEGITPVQFRQQFFQ